MKSIRYIVMLLALVSVFALAVCADDGFMGGWDDLTPSETTTFEDTTEPEETETTETPGTTDAEDTETTSEPETSTAEDTSEPEVSGSEEQTTEPESSAGETTAPEESVSGEQTSEPAENESSTESGDATTERPDVQTTEPAEVPSETETQQGGGSSLPLPLILGVLGAFGVGCIALVVFVLIKYARAQKA